MRRYETISIIHPNSGDEIINEIVAKTTGIIENFGGSIVKIDKWGLKKLAYQINKEEQGYYVLIEYAGQPEAVDELERIFRIDDRVLKYMTVKTQEVFIPAEPGVETETAKSTSPIGEEDEDLAEDEDLDDEDE
ncbi:MAG: 30S ribosomal protein S6 [Proteobacteria bacterium]|nr:30S ribosomal protein S6 [Pseudomonadota bacterium]MBU1716281.1 30S ribosomal protein S6 [Pseudomonadota bacterium]